MHLLKTHPSLLPIFGLLAITTLLFSCARFAKATLPLQYVFRNPKVETKNPPLVLLLHGVGSNEKDLFSFAEQLPDNFLVVSARAPIDLGHGGYGWYKVQFTNGAITYDKSQEEKSRKILLDFIAQLPTNHNFDVNRIYVVGFSQGAIMSYNVGLTHPEKFKGIAAMSGRLLEEIKPSIAPKERVQNLNLLITHGIQDDVLSVQYARQGKEYLVSYGLNPTYKEYEEGHGINSKNLNDLINWLTSSEAKK